MAVGAGAAIIMLLLFVVLGMEDSINMNQYLTIEAEGYDGYGKLHAAINWDAVEEKYWRKIIIYRRGREDIRRAHNLMSPMDALQDCVRVELETYSGLSNGDTVAYTWKVNRIWLTC